MSKTLRITLICLLVPVGLALMVGIVFASDRLTRGGEILGRVTVADVELGGLSEGDALAVLADLEGRLAASPVPVTVAGHHFSLYPADMSFGIDEDALVARAMGQGREGHLGTQFGWWITHLGGDGTPLEIPYAYDEAALAAQVAEWETAGLADPPFPGDVAIADGEVTFRYPAPGVGIDRAEAARLLGTALGDPDRAEVALPTSRLDPPLSDADIEAVVARAQRLLAGDVTLIGGYSDHRLVIPASVLGRSLTVTRDDTTSPPSFTFAWDPAPLRSFLAPRRAALTTRPVEAELLIDVTTDEVTIKPGLSSQEPDPEALAARVDQAARSGIRFAGLPYREGAEPEATTAEIEALGVTGLIGEFTTPHNCCEPRVTNIHLIADATDGAMVMPGETWSLNEHVGQRTAAKGYVAAPAIIAGELTCCDSPINIGGGTSQWTTTLYNALFFAGLEDVFHSPHSTWISRYPEGREATLGWPAPDLVFRNNTEHAVIIRTLYTDTSVTAKIYGDNGGLQVEAGLSGRYNYTGIVTRYLRNAAVPPGDEWVKQSGSGGWSVDVFRYITYPDGHQTTEKWTWHYSGLYRIIERHPCMFNNTCPDPEPQPGV
ncbi:MAG TPA: VanW family protein [Acidimicrobiia bacterium]|nr:VanW family protein [Acidimicrobiia bacterium]